jgi:hypothetical protein
MNFILANMILALLNIKLKFSMLIFLNKNASFVKALSCKLGTV